MQQTFDENPYTGCKCTEIRHESGLTVRVCEMPGFHTAQMSLTVRFGSDSLCYRLDGTEYRLLPGTAHYLEHQLLENQDIHALSAFSRLGAYANAATYGDMTTYEARTAHNVYEVLALLLRTVQDPAFTEKTVEKERGIIASELRRVMDSPLYRLSMRLRAIRYAGHPYCEDPVGNMKSISEISRDMLMQAYSHWYTPNNMLLACAGNIAPDAVMETVDRVLKRIPPKKPETVFPPVSLVLPQKVFRLTDGQIGVPITALEFASDLTGLTKEEKVRRGMYTDLASEIIFGDMTEFEEQMLRADMYVSSRQVNSGSDNFRNVVLMVLEPSDSEAYQNAVFAELDRVQREGMDKELFRAIMRSAYANACAGQRTPANMASLMASTWRDGFQPFDPVRMFHACSLEAIEAALPLLFPQTQCMRYEILPEDAGEEGEFDYE